MRYLYYVLYADESSVLESGSIWTVLGWLQLRKGSGTVMTVIPEEVIQSDPDGRERGCEFGILDILVGWVAT